LKLPNGFQQVPLQHCSLCVQVAPEGLQLPAFALPASPKQASAMPARPTPNFFSAARRAPRDGLGHALGEFIEFVVHTFRFVRCRSALCKGQRQRGIRVVLGRGWSETTVCITDPNPFLVRNTVHKLE
jgi:hypothetical protein